MNQQRERRLLKLAVALACLVPLGAGTVGVVLGPSAIESGIAGDYLELESHFRYLSGLLFGIGIAFAASIATIERRSELFSALCLVVVVGGLARVWAIMAYDMAAAPNAFALVMELAVVPLLFLWQRRVARASSPTHMPS